MNRHGRRRAGSLLFSLMPEDFQHAVLAFLGIAWFVRWTACGFPFISNCNLNKPVLYIGLVAAWAFLIYLYRVAGDRRLFLAGIAAATLASVSFSEARSAVRFWARPATGAYGVVKSEYYRQKYAREHTARVRKEQAEWLARVNGRTPSRAGGIRVALKLHSCAVSEQMTVRDSTEVVNDLECYGWQAGIDSLLARDQRQYANALSGFRYKGTDEGWRWTYRPVRRKTGLGFEGTVAVDPAVGVTTSRFIIDERGIVEELSASGTRTVVFDAVPELAEFHRCLTAALRDAPDTPALWWFKEVRGTGARLEYPAHGVGKRFASLLAACPHLHERVESRSHDPHYLGAELRLGVYDGAGRTWQDRKATFGVTVTHMAADERHVTLLAFLWGSYADVGYRFFTVSADGEVHEVPKPLESASP